MIPFPNFLDCSVLPPAIVGILIFFIFFLPPGVFSLQNLYNSVVFMSVAQNLIGHSLMTPSCSTSSHVVLEDLHIIFMKWLLKLSDIWNNWANSQFIVQVLHVVHPSSHCICSVSVTVPNASVCCLQFHFLWYFLENRCL